MSKRLIFTSPPSSVSSFRHQAVGGGWGEVFLLLQGFLSCGGHGITLPPGKYALNAGYHA